MIILGFDNDLPQPLLSRLVLGAIMRVRFLTAGIQFIRSGSRFLWSGSARKWSESDEVLMC